MIHLGTTFLFLSTLVCNVEAKFDSSAENVALKNPWTTEDLEESSDNQEVNFQISKIDESNFIKDRMMEFNCRQRDIHTRDRIIGRYHRYCVQNVWKWKDLSFAQTYSFKGNYEISYFGRVGHDSYTFCSRNFSTDGMYNFQLKCRTYMQKYMFLTVCGGIGSSRTADSLPKVYFTKKPPSTMYTFKMNYEPSKFDWSCKTASDCTDSLECTRGDCKCSNDTIEYSNGARNVCLPKRRLTQRCMVDEQCRSTNSLSYCSVFRRCDCNMQSVMLKNDLSYVCMSKSIHGNRCTYDKQCNDGGEFAVCRTTCRCREGYTYYNGKCERLIWYIVAGAILSSLSILLFIFCLINVLRRYRNSIRLPAIFRRNAHTVNEPGVLLDANLNPGSLSSVTKQITSGVEIGSDNYSFVPYFNRNCQEDNRNIGQNIQTNH